MNPLQKYIEQNQTRQATVGDEKFTVRLATSEQIKQFQAEASNGDKSPESQIDFCRRWLAVLVPDFAELENQDIPPALLLEIAAAVWPVAFGGKKN